MSITDLKTKTVDGHDITPVYTAVNQPKATILMVHGITADHTEWGYYTLLAEALAKEGVSSIAFDLRGHGSSDIEVEKLSLSGAMLDIQAAWELLCDLHQGKDLKRFIIGNSFGGGITYLFGNQASDVDHVFLTAPVLSYIDDIEDMADAWKKSGLSTFTYVKFSLSSLLVPEMHYFDTRIADAIANVPFTVIHGEVDSDVPFISSKNFVANRPSGNLIGMKGMDHCWANPGDLPPFSDPQSVSNRMVAVRATVEQILKSVG